MSWTPPRDWLRVRTIDAHTAGEPLRIVTGGFPEPEGRTILERRAWAREHLDDLRRALMLEPRGHADMYGCLPVPPEREDGDVGVLFLHNEGWSTMCGHGVIAYVTVAAECGLLPIDAERPTVRLDTPAGRVVATAQFDAGGRVERVSFENVPAFLETSDLDVQVPGLGRVRCDVAFGGAFYAYVDAGALGLDLGPAGASALIDAGRRIQHAVAAAHAMRHPDGAAELEFLYGVIFVGPAREPDAHSRNVCVFADGEVDRSPTGTGVSGRAAIHVARGELEVGERIEIESILGTRFGVRAARTERVGELAAIVPVVDGAAWITGRHEFLVDPRDPLRGAFSLRSS